MYLNVNLYVFFSKKKNEYYKWKRCKFNFLNYTSINLPF